MRLSQKWMADHYSKEYKRSAKFGGVIACQKNTRRLAKVSPGWSVRIHSDDGYKSGTVLSVSDIEYEDMLMYMTMQIDVTVKTEDGDTMTVDGDYVEIVGRRNPARAVRSGGTRGRTKWHR